MSSEKSGQCTVQFSEWRLSMNVTRTQGMTEVEGISISRKNVGKNVEKGRQLILDKQMR
jgi:hypothetical protein